MYWWLWLIPIAGTLVFLWFLRKGPPHWRHVETSRLQTLVSQFVRKPVTGSVMVLEREQTAGVLQLTLRTNDRGGHDLEFGIPDVDWSSESFDMLYASFRDAGYDVSLEQSGRCARVRRFLRASTSCGAPSLADAGMHCIEVAAGALGWGPETTYTVHCERRRRNQTIPAT